MCDSVWNKGREIDSIGALRELWPVLIVDPMYTHGIPDDPATCLCPVDIVASAKANGAEVCRSENQMGWDVK